MTTVPQVPNLTNLTNIPKVIGAWLAEVVEATHKQAAALTGILATAGIAWPTGRDAGYALLAYAAVCHVAENLFPKAPKAS